MSSYPDLGRAKAQLVALRIRELHDVLDVLHLKKHGRKPDLSARVLEFINEADAEARATGNITRLRNAVDALEAAYARLVQDGGRGVMYMPPPPGAPSHQVQQPPASRAVPNGQPSGSRAPAGTVPGSSHSVPAANGATHKQSILRTTSLVKPFGINPGAVPPGLGSLPIPQIAPHNHGSPNKRTQCLCGQAAFRGNMVTCSICQVMQHADCLAWPLGSGTGTHVCERCRSEQCDPFWQVVDHTVAIPAKMQATGRSALVGTKAEPVLQAERTFNVSSVHYDLVKRRPKEYRLQVSCLQLHDSCTYRFHWPTNCELRVNGLQYRVYSRSPASKMGANQRDEPANISVLCSQGKPNKLLVSGADSGQYVVLVQLAKSRNLQEVKGLMRRPETIEQAVARVKRQVGGGAEEDEDLQVTHTIVPLRCPLTGARIATPARFVDVPGLSCFDLDSFLTMAEKSKKWQCPNSMKFTCIRNLQVDTFLERVLVALTSCPDVSEVEIDAEGRWRPAVSGGPGQPWHQLGEMPFTGPNAIKIKAENGGPSHGVGPSGGGDYDDDDEESEDEMEELRKAAAAMKRARPPPDVIEILDSSDDDTPARKRPTAPPQHPAAAATQRAGNGSGAGPSGRPGLQGQVAGAGRELVGGPAGQAAGGYPLGQGHREAVGPPPRQGGGQQMEGFGQSHANGSAAGRVYNNTQQQPLPPGLTSLNPSFRQHQPHPHIPVHLPVPALGLAVLSTAAAHVALGAGRSGSGGEPGQAGQQQQHMQRPRPPSDPPARSAQPPVVIELDSD